MDGAKVRELKQLVEECKSNPSLLHNPSLSFFKSYLLRSVQFLHSFVPFSIQFNSYSCYMYCSLGARIPPQPKTVSFLSLSLSLCLYLSFLFSIEFELLLI